MGKKIDGAFKREVSEFAISSGLSRKQVASDFGVCISSVDRWIKRFSDIPADLTTQNDLIFENKRLRRELQVALQERDILKLRRSVNDPVDHLQPITPPSSLRAKSDALCIH